jgi:preprotein translocase subunit SecA
MTNSFGRGTDFKIYDDSVLLKGGLHVIQTFLSTETSEEVQIEGRTARQGNKGSYKLLFQEENLELLRLKGKEITDLAGELSRMRVIIEEEASKTIK